MLHIVLKIINRQLITCDTGKTDSINFYYYELINSTEDILYYAANFRTDIIKKVSFWFCNEAGILREYWPHLLNYLIIYATKNNFYPLAADEVIELNDEYMGYVTRVYNPEIAAAQLDSLIQTEYVLGKFVNNLVNSFISQVQELRIKFNNTVDSEWIKYEEYSIIMDGLQHHAHHLGLYNGDNLYRGIVEFNEQETACRFDKAMMSFYIIIELQKIGILQHGFLQLVEKSEHESILSILMEDKIYCWIYDKENITNTKAISIQELHDINHNLVEKIFNHLLENNNIQALTSIIDELPNSIYLYTNYLMEYFEKVATNKRGIYHEHLLKKISQDHELNQELKNDMIKYILQCYYNIHINSDVPNLLKALTDNQYTIAEYLLDYNMIDKDINLADSQGVNALMFCSKKGHYSLVKKILNYQANPNITDLKFRTPLLLAADNNEAKCVALLLEYGAGINYSDNNNNTALMHAAKNGNNELIHICLRYSREQIDRVNNDGMTALLYAVHFAHIESAKLLAAAGANLEQHIGHDNILTYTYKHSSLDLVKFFINSYQVSTWSLLSGKFYILNKAVEHNDIAALDYFLSLGIHINMINGAQFTPLETAIYHSNHVLVEYLLNKGADVNLSGNDNLTPLMQALDNGDGSIVDILLAFKPDLSKVDRAGNNALHYAARTMNYNALYSKIYNLMVDDHVIQIGDVVLNDRDLNDESDSSTNDEIVERPTRRRRLN